MADEPSKVGDKVTLAVRTAPSHQTYAPGNFSVAPNASVGLDIVLLGIRSQISEQHMEVVKLNPDGGPVLKVLDSTVALTLEELATVRLGFPQGVELARVLVDQALQNGVSKEDVAQQMGQVGLAFSAKKDGR